METIARTTLKCTLIIICFIWLQVTYGQDTINHYQNYGLLIIKRGKADKAVLPGKQLTIKCINGQKTAGVLKDVTQEHIYLQSNTIAIRDIRWIKVGNNDAMHATGGAVFGVGMGAMGMAIYNENLSMEVRLGGLVAGFSMFLAGGAAMVTPNRKYDHQYYSFQPMKPQVDDHVSLE